MRSPVMRIPWSVFVPSDTTSTSRPARTRTRRSAAACASRSVVRTIARTVGAIAIRRRSRMAILVMSFRAKARSRGIALVPVERSLYRDGLTNMNADCADFAEALDREGLERGNEGECAFAHSDSRPMARVSIPVERFCEICEICEIRVHQRQVLSEHPGRGPAPPKAERG